MTQTPSGASPAGCAGDASGADVARARDLIDATQLGDEQTLAALEDIRFTGAGTLAACQRLQEGADGDALWAATWIYVSSGTDPSPLLPLMASDDRSVRVIAAAGLSSLGRLEGLDALIDSVTDDAALRGSLPPVTISQFAATTLSRYVDASVTDAAPGTPEERTALAAAWSAWLTEHRDQLAFDPEQRIWAVE